MGMRAIVKSGVQEPDQAATCALTPDLRPLIGQFKVESATPFSVGQRPPSRPAAEASLRSVRPRRGGP